MITGAHTVIYSKNPDADKALFKDVLKLSNVDVGHGWLICGLPPSEVAFHPGDENSGSEFYLLCDDIRTFVKEMATHKLTCSEISEQRWGSVIQLTLPGGGKIGVYQPKHA